MSQIARLVLVYICNKSMTVNFLGIYAKYKTLQIDFYRLQIAIDTDFNCRLNIIDWLEDHIWLNILHILVLMGVCHGLVNEQQP